jgi:hypothetical protein
VRLYHLLSAQHGLSNIERRQLKIAQLSDLNDPFELVAANHSDPLHRQIWRGWRREQENRWGMLCFSKSWHNPVLWSHYGDKHRGLALGFDVDDSMLMPVKYTENRIKIDVVRLQQEGKLTPDHMNRLMRTKFSDWKYEREVRIFSSLKEKDPQTGLYFVSFSDELTLREVIAGPLCELSESEIASKVHSKDNPVIISKARLAFTKFRVVPQRQGFKPGADSIQ